MDKPAGLHTAPLKPGEPETLLAWVTARYPEIAALPGRKSTEPGLLHRLDRGTSGIVIIARTAEAFARLRAEFSCGRVRKQYMALCASRKMIEPGSRLCIESRFAPWGPGRRKVRVLMPAEAGKKTGREATKRLYETELEAVDVREHFVLMRASVVRGFRHQVRAHLAHLGLPIVGDPLYGVPAPAGAPDRMYLHAASIELAHPLSGAPLLIRSELPAEFEALR